MKNLSVNTINSFVSKRVVIAKQFASVCLFIALHFCSVKTSAQITIAAWNPSSPTALSTFGPSPWTPTTAAANVTIGGLTRGSGVSTTGTAAGSAWGGTNWQGTSEANAISINEYASFTAKANSGYMASFSGLSLFYRRSGTGPSNGQLQYSTDGITYFDVTGGAFAYTNTTSTGALLTPSVDLTGVLALQNVPATTTVYFRIVNWGGTSTSGTWYIFSSSGLQVTGTVNVSTPCSGTPTAGSVSPIPTTICGSGASALTLTGGATGTGLSYQWSSSASPTPPGTSISGATSSSYATPPITSTTYYWCTTTCAASSLSNISSTGTVTYNTLPTVSVTPSGGNVCSGGTGLSMTASGASTYIWSPVTGLSATTGATITANPGSNITYTVTGTASTGCSASNTATVTATPSPASVAITPTTLTTCQGSAPGMIYAAGGAVGPTFASSGTVNFPVNTPLDNVPDSFVISGIPSGAAITSASVTLNFSSSFVHDYIFNLVAPNGKIINLVNQALPSGAGSFTNTVISSSSSTALSTGTTPYTATFAADAASAVGPAGFLSNTTSWPALFTVPNGTWSIIAYNSSTFADVSTFISGSIALNYSAPIAVTWSPASQLYTNSVGTIGYTSTATDTVYLNPLAAAVVTYTATATNGACSSSAIITTTVNPVSAISGVPTLCVGLTTGLSDIVSGGTWTSSNTAVATIGSSSGIATGILAGTSAITYTLSTGCTAFTTITVNTTPPGITGTTSVCEGLTTALSDGGGGAWSSSSTTNAMVNPITGIVTGVTAGTATISYVLSTGCSASSPVTVNPTPVTIAGLSNVCVGSTINLSDAISGGTWTSLDPTVTVVPASGDVNGILQGTATITYTLPAGCTAFAAVTVNTTPSAISGTMTVCGGLTTALSDAGGGSWSSSSTANATVDIVTGIVSGVSAGTATISYTLSTGCNATAVVTVNLTPLGITGASTVCAGSTISLTDGTSSGTWSSSSTSLSIGSGSGVVTGLSGGTATVSYSLSTGCTATTSVTVNPSPVAITGITNVCVGSTTSLSDAGGGNWSSSNTTVGAVNAITGVVTGLSGGTTSITYSFLTGCSAETTVTVDLLPLSITGMTTVCTGATTALSDAGGGAWSSSNTSVAIVDPSTGVVTGVLPGTATITYSLATGCTTSVPVTVNLSPSNVTGTFHVCVGSTTALSDAGGGTWSSSNTSVATVVLGTGVTSGIFGGTSVITYTLSNGCTATTPVTVNTLPSSITGIATVCVGATTNLSDAGGGTWSSSITTAATVVTGTGVVSGVSFGTSVITYTLGTGCTAATTVTVNPLPSGITGVSSVCVGLSTTLSDVGGGAWSSSNTGVAIVASGTVAGVTQGTATITYKLATGCITTDAVTVNPLPSGISGGSNICVASNITLSDAGGGTWTSNNTSVATIVLGTGVATGVSSGTAVITYTLGTGCLITKTETVNPLPLSITGVATVCVGLTTTLTDAGGGTWTSSNTSVAIASPGTGAVGGVSAGTASITYTLSTGCTANTAVTVNPLPTAILGSTSVCISDATTLSDGGGGTWTSSNTSVATVDLVTGVVNGITASTATITYILATGCETTQTVTVNPLPLSIIGLGTVCAGLTTSLSDLTTGGTWSSSNTTLATVTPGGGVVTGISTGNPIITYTSPLNCVAITTATVNPLPSAITGTTGVCIGFTSTLSDAGGGVWTSSNTLVANVGSGTGIVTGIAGGTSSITYTLPTGCLTTSTATVNSVLIPSVGISSGTTDTICVGTILTFVATPVNGGSVPVYQWEVNGSVVGTTANFYSYTPANGDIVSAMLTSNAVCAVPDTASDSAVIVVLPNVTPSVSFSITPGDPVCQGSPAMFSAIPVFGGTAPTFRWTQNSINVATGPTYTYIPSNGDIIHCMMVSNIQCNLADSVFSTDTTVVVVPATTPVFAMNSLQGIHTYTGESDTFTAAVTTTVAHTYQWLINGVVLPGATSATFVSDTLSNNDSVTCVVTNTDVCGLSSSNSIIIGVSNVGIRPVAIIDNIAVSPNPSKGTFTVKGSLGITNDEQVSIEITDMIGQAVYKNVIVAVSGQINEHVKLSNTIASGQYILNVRSGVASKVFHIVIEQ